MNINEIGSNAKKAARRLARATSEQKTQLLNSLADRLLVNAEAILAANARDVQLARGSGLAASSIDRLMLNPSRLEGIVADLRSVAEMLDPVGEVIEQSTLPNGLRARRQRVPLGVLGVIYEARPNVTIDVAGLAIKTGNAAILRGGSETIHSNRLLVAEVQAALVEHGFPAEAIQFIDDPDRALVHALLQLHEYVDIIIPRGGAKLHAFCREHSRIPVITGGIGICHLYVDASADLDAALPVIRNAKIQRPTVCNALDTALVHRDVAAQFLPRLVNDLQADGVTFRADPSVLPYFPNGLPGGVAPAGESDFDTEWLSLVLGLKVVGGLDEAIAHIEAHSTAHSDGILTQDAENARRFVAEVDSAAVYVNASTRFTDGAQLGLGAEVAVSTQRLHARGPMGLKELTTYKWVIEGEYHTRG
jgi:glutamate-5-semialdehyde dehydrogenase